MLGAITDSRPQALEEALSEAADAELVEVTAVSGRFAHDLVREVLYSAPPPDLVATRSHRAAAEVVERLAPGGGRAAEVAHHLLRTEDFARAATYAARAGEEASAGLAFEEAEAHFARALDAHECCAPRPSPSMRVAARPR